MKIKSLVIAPEEVEDIISLHPQLYLESYQAVKNILNQYEGFQSACNIIFKSLKNEHKILPSIVDFILIMSHFKNLEKRGDNAEQRVQNLVKEKNTLIIEAINLSN